MTKPLQPFHQVTLHLVDAGDAVAPTNPVDGDSVPARHFGIVLTMPDWKSLAARQRSRIQKFRRSDATFYHLTAS